MTEEGNERGIIRVPATTIVVAEERVRRLFGQHVLAIERLG